MDADTSLYRNWDFINSWKPATERNWCENCTPRVEILSAMYEHKIDTLHVELTNIAGSVGYKYQGSPKENSEDIPVKKALDYMRECEQDCENKIRAIEKEAAKREANHQNQKTKDDRKICDLQLQLSNSTDNAKTLEVYISQLESQVECFQNEITMINKEKKTLKNRCGNQKDFFHAFDDKRSEEQEQIAALQKENHALKDAIEKMELENEQTNYEVVDAEIEVVDVPAPESLESEFFSSPEVNESSIQRLWLYCLLIFYTIAGFLARNDSLKDSLIPVDEQETEEVNDDGHDEEDVDSIAREPSEDLMSPPAEFSTTYAPPVGRRTYRNAVKAAKKLMRQQRSEELVNAQQVQEENLEVQTTNYMRLFMKFFIILLVSITLAKFCVPGASSLEIAENVDIFSETFPNLSLSGLSQ